MRWRISEVTRFRASKFGTSQCSQSPHSHPERSTSTDVLASLNWPKNAGLCLVLEKVVIDLE